MSNPARILVFGRDSSLLETRQLVLETIGGIVDATTKLDQARLLLAHSAPDLLILCYTLSPDDRSTILGTVRKIRPELKVLVLRADGPASVQTDDEEFNIFWGAGALRARVKEMLKLQISGAFAREWVGNLDICVVADKDGRSGIQ